ncbi:MAG: T9SS type A sorting domain-containing protein [Bacteroidota bacterium]
MKIRLILFSALATLIIAGLSPAQGKKGIPPGKVEPYSISVTALQGPTTSDVLVTVTTNDEANFPVPDSFKKLQIKVLNSDGNAVYVRNFFDVPIVDGTALVSVTDLLPGMPVEVHALIQTEQTVNTKVLWASTVVLLRPDLVIKEVDAPEQVQPDVPFNIEVVVQETKFQSGATANVSLVEGATVLATATGIVVNAGGEVSVLFQGVMLSGTGTHNLTARISDAVPAEYDTTNNEYPFSIEVVGGLVVEKVAFTLEYERRKNIDISIVNINCGVVTSEREVGDRGSWAYSATIPFAPVTPIDSIRWEAISSGGTLSRGFLAGLNAEIVNSSFDVYSGEITDADGSMLTFSIFVNKTTSVTGLSLNKFAGDYYYVQRFFDGTTDSVSQSSSQMDLEDFLEIRLLFADGGQYFGGGAQIDVLPYELEVVSFNDSTVSGGCLFQTIVDVTHEVSSNFTSGVTDPILLPTGKAGTQSLALMESSVPQMTDLAQNYPNPFNPTTTIQFSVRQTGPAVLKIYDMLGKEVAELFSGEAVEGRSYQFTFDATNFSSGMYYAKLEANGRFYTKRMILIK